MKKLISIILALVLVSVLSVSAFAAVSPVAPVEKDYEGVTVTITPNVQNPSQLTFEAVEKEGYKFIGWDIEVDYEKIAEIKGEKDPVTGLYKNPVTVIMKDGTVLTDIDVNPIYEKIDSATPDEEEPDDDEGDDEDKKPADKKPSKKPADKKPADESPKTSDSMAMLALAAIALGGAVVSKKRLSK